MLPIILKYKLRQTYNTLTHSSRQKRLGWLISVALIAPFYVTFTRTMSQMYGAIYESSGWEGLAQMVSGNLAIIFFFIFISAAALTLYRMFQAKDLAFLMSLPATDGSLFLSKLAESLTYTARSMILPFPICISFLFVIISKARMPFTAAIFLIGWLAVMVQLACLSVIVALILGRFIVSSRWAFFLRMIAIVASLAFLLMFFASYVHQIEPGASLSGSVPIAVFLPTSWLVAALPHLGFTPFGGFLYAAGFVAMTVGCLAGAFYLFRARFRRLWMMTGETKRRRGRQRASVRNKPSAKMGRTRAVISKEITVMRREPHTWIGFVILLVIFPVFILFKASDLGTQAIYIIIISLLTTASYSLSCVGKEGRNFALLRSLPVRMSAFLRAKYLLGGSINLVVTLAFVTALYLTGRSSLEQMRHNILIGGIAAVYLSAFGTALAAIFPKFDFTNPMRASSLPGLLLLYLFSVLFGVTFVGIASIGWYFTPLVLAPWAGVVLILMKVGQNRLEKMDV